MTYTYVVKVDLINTDDQRFFSTTVEVQSGQPLNLAQIEASAYDKASAFISGAGYEELDLWLVDNPTKYDYDFTLIGAFRE